MHKIAIIHFSQLLFELFITSYNEIIANCSFELICKNTKNDVKTTLFLSVSRGNGKVD